MTISSHVWSAGQTPRLIASRDTRTAALRFPAFTDDSPLVAGHETVEIPELGKVYSFSTVHPNPKSGAQPFALGYVDLPGPVRIFGRIAGGEVRIGATCQAVPDAEFGYVFQVTA